MAAQTVRVVVRTTAANAKENVERAVEQALRAQYKEMMGPLGPPLAAKVAEIMGQKAEEVVYGEVYIPSYDEEYYWFEVNYLSGLDIPYQELGADEATRKEGINIIKETYAEKGVDRETIVEWEKVFVNLFGPEFENRFVPAESATKGDWIGLCDADLAWALVDFHNELLARYPVTFGGKQISIVSAYRRLGTDVIPNDRNGKNDARDPTGAAHWKGLAVDVATYIPDTLFGGDIAALDTVLRRVGLERTNKIPRESNHYGLRKAK